MIYFVVHAQKQPGEQFWQTHLRGRGVQEEQPLDHVVWGEECRLLLRTVLVAPPL